MTDNEEKMAAIMRRIWKGTGQRATYEEVLAAKAELEQIVPHLITEREKGRSNSLFESLGRLEHHVMPPEMVEEEIRKYGAKRHRQTRE